MQVARAVMWVLFVGLVFCSGPVEGKTHFALKWRVPAKDVDGTGIQLAVGDRYVFSAGLYGATQLKRQTGNRVRLADEEGPRRRAVERVNRALAPVAVCTLVCATYAACPTEQADKPPGNGVGPEVPVSRPLAPEPPVAASPSPPPSRSANPTSSDRRLSVASVQVSSRSQAHTWEHERGRVTQLIEEALSGQLTGLTQCLAGSTPGEVSRLILSITPDPARKSRIYRLTPTIVDPAAKKCLIERIVTALHAGRVPVGGRGGPYSVRVEFRYRVQPGKMGPTHRRWRGP